MKCHCLRLVDGARIEAGRVLVQRIDQSAAKVWQRIELSLDRSAVADDAVIRASSNPVATPRAPESAPTRNDEGDALLPDPSAYDQIAECVARNWTAIAFPWRPPVDYGETEP